MKPLFLCASVGCSWRGSIALLWVLRCETLICDDWVKSDLDVHRGLGEPRVQPEPLKTDVVVDGRSPTLRQVAFRIGPIRGVKENWVMNPVTEVQRARNKRQDCGMGGKKIINVLYKWSSLGTMTVPWRGPAWYNEFFSSSSEVPSAPRVVLYMSNKQLVTSQSYGNGWNMSLRLLTMAHQYDWSPSAAFSYPFGPGRPKSAVDVGGASAGVYNPLWSAR